MKQPIYWKGNEAKNKPSIESSNVIKLNDTIKLALCLVFLIVSCGLWIAVDSQFRWLASLLLFIPGYMSAGWLSKEISRLRISQNGFSIAQILYWMIITLGLIAVGLFVGLFLFV